MKKTIITIFCLLYSTVLMAGSRPCSVIMPVVIRELINMKDWEPALRPYTALSERLDEISPNTEHLLNLYLFESDSPQWIQEVIFAVAIATDTKIPVTDSIAPVASMVKNGFASFHEIVGIKCSLKNESEAKIYVAIQSLIEYK